MEVTEDEIVLACEVCVEEGDYDSLEELLDATNLDDMTLSEVRNLYYFLVRSCRDFSRDELVVPISDYFKRNLVQGVVIETFLFSEPNAEDVLEYFYSHNGRKFGFYVEALFSLSMHAELELIFSRLKRIALDKGEVTYKTCQVLLESLYRLSEDEVPFGEVVEELLKDLAAQVAPVSDAPAHVLDPTEFGFDSVPTFDSLVSSLPVPPVEFPRTKTRYEEIKEVAESMAKEKYDADEIPLHSVPSKTQEIVDEILNFDLEEFSSFLEAHNKKEWERSLQTDVDVFRVLGPCHPKVGQYGLDTNDPYPCRRWGGCRMLTCVENETEDDEERLRYSHPEMIEWFTGSCDRCSKTILKKYWAFRILLESGGFKGCYCSKEHAVLDCIDWGQPGAKMLTEKALTELTLTGIYDRDETSNTPSLSSKPDYTKEMIQFMEYLKTVTPIEPEQEIDLAE